VHLRVLSIGEPAVYRSNTPKNPSSQEVIIPNADFPPPPGWQMPSWSTTFSSSSSPKPNF
ncbi:hypothetical protein, partial [Trichormus azollae]|uniref:hypothetical protein n=1 Tax=Trichormus azollae TaxID=1164 RepID=UPI00325FC0C1